MITGTRTTNLGDSGSRCTDSSRSLQLITRASAATALSIVALFALSVASAGATIGGPQWTVTAISRPTNFEPGDQTGDDAYVVTVTNTGGTASNGSEPLLITDELPEGLSLAGEPHGEDALAVANGHAGSGSANFSCLLNTCIYTGVIEPGDALILEIPVDVNTVTESLERNVVRVSGGGAIDASMADLTKISANPAGFGIASGGSTTAFSTTQAGAHPDFTTSLWFNTTDPNGSLAGDPKDTTDILPPGFAGDLVDTPSCSPARFSLHECPIDTQVGVTTLMLHLNGTVGPDTEPVYNLSPNPGEVAKIGFNAGGNSLSVEGGVSVRPSDYALETTFQNIDEAIAELDGVSLTIWGVPAAKIHDPLRWKPGDDTAPGSFGASSDAALAPFVSSPTSCDEQLEASVVATSWEQQTVTTEIPISPFVGCDRLTLPSTIIAEPTTNRAYAASGLNFQMNVHQTYDNPEGLATSTLRSAVVSLPEGMTVNPSAGAGLGACTEVEFDEESVEVQAGKGCPNDSKLGTVRILSPAIKEEATGSVFLAEPYKNPAKVLLALYVVARIADRGVIVKLTGRVTPDLTTGQLVTTFTDLPPLPFSVFTFSFHSGATSPLVTPDVCGTYIVQAVVTSAAEPSQALPAIFAPPFAITSGFDGGECPTGGIAPFAPQVIAGSQNNSAASYSPLYIRIVRGDGEQEITRFSARLPAGLTANLTAVPFCPDSDIEQSKRKTGAEEEAEPSCPAASQIGHTVVGAGVGSVLAQASGRVYMAGPYNGAPLSIVSITAAKVGPFDLGTVVVRLALRINPLTAVVTVDASASDPIPHIIQGIVVHVRDIRVYIDRQNFSLNPTNCERLTFSSTVSGSGVDFTSSADDVPVTVTDPFQAADCQALKFTPRFRVSTSGSVSRRKGASLSAELSYPNLAAGLQANIRAVKVDLPKELPSRLTTLQKACTDAVFSADPSSCPPSSRVGEGKAVTPILPVPLIGPAYFVSHGSAKFPELIVVLQGYGVTIDLRGETAINKAGITSSTFRAVPDQPVTNFVLTLPQGANSALAANGNLCREKLVMPTVFTAQNGLVFRQQTPVSVTHCPKRKSTKKAKTSHVGGRGRGV